MDSKNITKDILVELLRTFNVEFSSNEKKAELLIKLYKAYNNGVLEEIYKYIGCDAYEILKMIIKGKDLIKDESIIEILPKSICILKQYMILDYDFKNGEMKYIINDEIKDKLLEVLKTKSIIKTKEYKKYKEIEKLIINIVIKYGVISYDELYDMLCDYIYEDEDLEYDYIYTLIYENMKLEGVLDIYGAEYLDENDKVVEEVDYIYLRHLENVSEIIDEKNRRTDLSYKKYNKEEMLDDSVYNKSSTDNIKNLVKHYIDNYDNAADRFVEFCLGVASMVDCNAQKILEIAGINFESKSLDESNDELNIIMKAYNDIPQYSLYGYSPNELIILHSKINKNNNKIGRNDLCTCGSGKKYKKCCLVKENIISIEDYRKNDFFELEDIEFFYKLLYSLLQFTNKKYNIVKNIGNIRKTKQVSPENVLKIKEKIWSDSNVIEEYIKINPDNFNNEELETISQWGKKHITGAFVIYKYTNEYAELLGDNGIYKIKGIAHSLSLDTKKTELPALISTTLIPFKGHIIYDSIVQKTNVRIGENMRKTMEEDYKKFTDKGLVISQL